MIRLWTDGSILVNPGGAGGWAFVAERNGKVIHTASGGDISSTNNRMELSAAIEALDWFGGECRSDMTVQLISDAQYVVYGVTRWRPAWERCDWQRVKNNDLWRRLCPLVDRTKAHVRWVRGHDGAEFNELADKLAGEAARSVDLAPTRRDLDDEEEHLDALAAGWVL